MEKTLYILAALAALGAWAAWISDNGILTCTLALASITALAVNEAVRERRQDA